MTKTVRRAAVSVLAASALVLAGGTAAIANEGHGPRDAAFFLKCKDEGFAGAGPLGAEAGHKFHCLNSLAISD